MPLIRISLTKGKSVTYKNNILKSIEEALTKIFNVSKKSQLILIHEHEIDQLIINNESSNHALLIVQIFAKNSRTIEQKKNLLAYLTELFIKNTNIKVENIFISLIDAPPENWFFGS